MKKGITNLTIFNAREEADGFKGVHAGYTKEELLILFIILILRDKVYK